MSNGRNAELRRSLVDELNSRGVVPMAARRCWLMSRLLEYVQRCLGFLNLENPVSMRAILNSDLWEMVVVAIDVINAEAPVGNLEPNIRNRWSLVCAHAERIEISEQYELLKDIDREVQALCMALR